MTKVIDICLCDADLEVEKKDQKNEDDQREPLHWVGLTKTTPLDAEVGNLYKKG